MNTLFSLVLLSLALVSCEKGLWIDTIMQDEVMNQYHISTVKRKSVHGSQGFSAYNDYCFVMQKGGTCYVYSYDTDTHPTASFKLACSHQNTHCNCLNWGGIPEKDNEFPLLYISNGEAGSPTELYCFVESIEQTTSTTFGSKTVQTLILDKSEFKELGYTIPVACPQWLVDNSRNTLWAFSLTTRTTVSAMGDMSNSKVVATCFRLPTIEEGDKIVLGAKDVIKQSLFEADSYILQGGCMDDGIIYMAYGYGGTESGTPAKIRVYNTDTEQIDLRLDLDGVIVDEPEDLCIYDDKLLLNTASYIYSFEMNEIRQMTSDKKLTARNFILEYE